MRVGEGALQPLRVRPAFTGPAPEPAAWPSSERCLEGRPAPAVPVLGTLGPVGPSRTSAVRVGDAAAWPLGTGHRRIARLPHVAVVRALASGSGESWEEKLPDPVMPVVAETRFL